MGSVSRESFSIPIDAIITSSQWFDRAKDSIESFDRSDKMMSSVRMYKVYQSDVLSAPRRCVSLRRGIVPSVGGKTDKRKLVASTIGMVFLVVSTSSQPYVPVIQLRCLRQRSPSLVIVLFVVAVSRRKEPGSLRIIDSIEIETKQGDRNQLGGLD